MRVEGGTNAFVVVEVANIKAAAATTFVLVGAMIAVIYVKLI